MKKGFALFVSRIVVFSLTISVAAVAPKAVSDVDATIRANSFARIGSSFTMESGDTVTINCTYSPKDADVDFALITPENKFRYLSGKSGSCKFAIEIPETGTYYFAVNNNANETVRVLGFVYY